MASLVTLGMAKEHLVVEGDEADIQIGEKIEQASSIVVDYLKRPAHGWSEATAPKNVQAAVLIVLTALYDDRNGAEMLAGLAGGDLRNPVVSLLYRMRDPAIA